MPGAPRNFICPASDAPCTDPACRRDLCREMQREHEAYALAQVALGKAASVDDGYPVAPVRPDERRAPYSGSEANARVMAFGAFVIGLGFLIWLLTFAIRHGY